MRILCAGRHLLLTRVSALDDASTSTFLEPCLSPHSLNKFRPQPADRSHSQSLDRYNFPLQGNSFTSHLCEVSIPIGRTTTDRVNEPIESFKPGCAESQSRALRFNIRPVFRKLSTGSLFFGKHYYPMVLYGRLCAGFGDQLSIDRFCIPYFLFPVVTKPPAASASRPALSLQPLPRPAVAAPRPRSSYKSRAANQSLLQSIASGSGPQPARLSGR